MCTGQSILGHGPIAPPDRGLAEKRFGRCPARDFELEETNEREDGHRRGKVV